MGVPDVHPSGRETLCVMHMLAMGLKANCRTGQGPMTNRCDQAGCEWPAVITLEPRRAN